MDVNRTITADDYMKIINSDEGVVLDGKCFKRFGAYESSLRQLEVIGKVSRDGEGICEKVFFFEIVQKEDKSDFSILDVTLQLISATIVDKYKYSTVQEAEKEKALIYCKIQRYEKQKKRGRE